MDFVAAARILGGQPADTSRPDFSLCENSESARFCSARLLSGHSSYRHDPQCPLERRALQNCASFKFSHRLFGAWVVQTIAFPLLSPCATMYAPTALCGV